MVALPVLNKDGTKPGAFLKRFPGELLSGRRACFSGTWGERRTQEGVRQAMAFLLRE